MAKIKQLTDKHGEIVYPVSREAAIYDENGVLLSNKISTFITRLVDNLANYYLKSEIYTKEEIDTLIRAIQGFSYIVVSELPVASAFTMGTIYLVPSEDPQTQNIKDEYITIRSGSIGSYTYSWEQIGSTAINLSGYVTTEALNAELTKYTTTANLTTLLAAKQDTIQDLATIRSGAAAGATAYQKPSGGIPKVDLASGVQGTLDLADTAIQSKPIGSITPPVNPSEYATQEELSQLDQKVDDLSSGKYYGYYVTAASLPASATVDGFAYVGSGPTYTIYNCVGGVWTSSGVTVNQSPIGNGEDIDQDAEGKLQFAPRVYNSSQPDGMGYKILRKDATFASQVTATNTIYEIRYNFDLNNASVTLPTGCVLKFNGGNIANGSLVLNNTLLSEDVKLRNISNISGSCANVKAYQSWFDNINTWHKFINNVTGPVELFYEKGEYSAEVYISKSIENLLTIHGNGARILYTYSTPDPYIFAYQLRAKDYLVYQQSNMSQEALCGDKEVSVSDTSVFSVGDYVSIRDNSESSFSYVRNYQQGEFAKITKIGEGTIFLDHPLWGNYKNLSSCVVYRINVATVSIDNLTIDVTNPDDAVSLAFYGLDIRQCITSLENVTVKNFHMPIRIAHSVSFTVTQCNVVANPNFTTGDGYGLNLVSSQNGRVNGGYYYGGSHAIAMTNNYTGETTIINRHIVVENVSALTITKQSLDSHGCSEFITFRNNKVESINAGGAHVTVEGNECSERISLTEITSYDHTIVNNKAKSFGIFVAGSTTENFTNWTPYNAGNILRIMNNMFVGDNTSDYSTIQFTNNIVSGVNGYPNVTVIIEGNSFVGSGFSISTRLPNEGSGVNAAAGKIIFNKNYFNNSRSLVGTLSANEMQFDNNTIDELGLQVWCNRITIRGNRVNNYAGAYVIFQKVSCEMVVVSENVVASGYLFITSGTKVSTLRVENNVCYGGADPARICVTTYSGSDVCSIYVAGNQMKSAWQIRLTGYSNAKLMLFNNIINDALSYGQKFGSSITKIEQSQYALSGTTRPTASSDITGLVFFDKTLGKSIVCDGTTWVNMDGTALS